MRKKITLLVALFISVGVANAAVRNDKTIARNSTNTNTARTVLRTDTEKNTANRNVAPKRNAISARSDHNTSNTTARNVKSNIARSAKSNFTLSQRTPVTGNTSSTARSTKSIVNRALSVSPDISTQMGSGYAACRDAYFTCMDQFCGTASDTYRRCYCSSRLTEIQSRERALTQAANQLEDFKSLNLYVIDKTANEVQSMVSASEGELAQSQAKDKSDSAKQLSGISAVLSKTKKESTENSTAMHTLTTLQA